MESTTTHHMKNEIQTQLAKLQVAIAQKEGAHTTKTWAAARADYVAAIRSLQTLVDPKKAIAHIDLLIKAAQASAA